MILSPCMLPSPFNYPFDNLGIHFLDNETFKIEKIIEQIKIIVLEII